jgi:hypothetical protein
MACLLGFFEADVYAGAFIAIGMWGGGYVCIFVELIFII